MNSPPKLSKSRPQKLINPPLKSEQQKAKLKLIQLSEMQETTGTESYQLFSSLLDTKVRSHRNITDSANQHEYSSLLKLNSCSKSTEINKHKYSINAIIRNKCRSVKSQRTHKTEQMRYDYLIRQPISINNYLMTGCSKSTEKQPHSNSAPKSDYIIRQRRNQNRLRRNKHKRQEQQAKSRNTIFEKLVHEKQKQKVLNMKSILHANKFKKYVEFSILYQR